MVIGRDFTTRRGMIDPGSAPAFRGTHLG